MHTSPAVSGNSGGAQADPGISVGTGVGARAEPDAAPAHSVALGSIIDRLEKVERHIREAEAQRIALLAEAFDLAAAESRRIEPTPSGPKAELAYRAIRAEIAVCLHQSERAVERQLSQAFTLTRDYRAVFEAYGSGAISEPHITTILDAGATIGLGDAPELVARRAGFEEAVLPHAIAETPGRLRPIARALAEQFAERPLDERHAEARRERRVYVLDAEDGMADLVAHLPAVEAYGIYDRLTRMARKIAQGSPARMPAPSSPERLAPARSRDEIRADALSDLLLEGGLVRPDEVDGTSTPAQNESRGSAAEAARGRIRGQVQVLLTERHLSGPAGPRGQSVAGEGATDPRAPDNGALFSAELPPPILQGYGAIDTATARRLAGEAAHWETIHEDAETGAILSVDRYRPSEEMRRLLGARDQHCRFPGCRVPLAHCDIDHTVDAARGGATNTRNLAHLCRGHHTLKHHTGWSVKQRADGVMDWRSPTGRRHTDLPPTMGLCERGRVVFRT